MWNLSRGKWRGKHKEMIRAILDNSIKYTAENGIIKIRLLTAADKINLSIEDNGEGISIEFKHNMPINTKM